MQIQIKVGTYMGEGGIQGGGGQKGGRGAKRGEGGIQGHIINLSKHHSIQFSKVSFRTF